MPRSLVETSEPPAPRHAFAASELAIECRGLRKVYDGKVEAVRQLDLEVRRGECFGLLGPNGAGKTTTIEILEGLLRPTAGEVNVLGQRWGADDERLRQHIGISLQETRLSSKLSVLETVRLFRSFYERGLDPHDVIERVSLVEKTHTWVGKLSGGQKQRLAIACALVGDPELLFLDEPTTGLDPRSRREVWGLVRDFQQRGQTVLITTHYMDEAERLCNRVAIVDRGEIIALGSPAELIASLGGEHVIEFAVAPRGGTVDEDTPREPSALDGAANGNAQAARELLPRLESAPAVHAARPEGTGVCLTVGEPHRAVPALLDIIERAELDLVRLTTRHASLEDVFVTLTGRHLSDIND